MKRRGRKNKTLKAEALKINRNFSIHIIFGFGQKNANQYRNVTSEKRPFHGSFRIQLSEAKVEIMIENCAIVFPER
jgi:hypothetical protein